MWGSALVLCVVIAAHGHAMELSADTAVATAGNYQLRWNADGPVVIEESRDPGFATTRIVYEGADRARVMSGKPDGDFYYRGRPVDGTGDPAWSEVLRVTVRHHSLERAFLFFTLGAIVFLTTLTMIIRGSRHTA